MCLVLKRTNHFDDEEGGMEYRDTCKEEYN